MKLWLAQRLEITRGVMLGVTSTFLVAQGLILAFVVLIAIGLVNAQKDVNGLAKENQQAIAQLKDQNNRLRRIERPTQQQLTNAALRALRAIRSCARSPRCRKQNPGVRQLARAIPRGEIPRRAPRRRRSTNASSGEGQGNGSGGTLTNPPSSPAPSQTGSRPQPTVRPPAASPTPANPPASPPQAAPKPQPAPAPTPAPPKPPPVVSVPPVTTPPITVPPVTVPPVTLPGVCVPLPGVVCPKVR